MTSRLALSLLAFGALLAAAPAFAQRAPSIGRSTGVVHGQSWQSGQQNLNEFGNRAAPLTRTQQLRQRSAAARRQTTATAPAGRQARRRAAN
jgi:hypothetical protein